MTSAIFAAASKNWHSQILEILVNFSLCFLFNLPIYPACSNNFNCESRGYMGVKLGSVVMVLMMFFIAKISFETAMAEKAPDQIDERSPASIDKSYNEHMNRR